MLFRKIRTPYSKLINFREELRVLCERLKKSGHKVVLTTGVYDLLHEGHLWYLVDSRNLGSVLVVGVNSDNHTKKIKGDGRPIIGEKQRALMIAGFECVDYVYIFNDRLDLVEIARPNIFVMSLTSHAKPNEGERLQQQEIVKMHGGEVRIFGPEKQESTTNIIEKIKLL